MNSEATRDAHSRLRCLVLLAQRRGCVQRWFREAPSFFPGLCVGLFLIFSGCSRAGDGSAGLAPSEPQGTRRLPGIVYWNDRKPNIPLSFHIVKIDRAQKDLVFVSAHARNSAIGLGTLSSQIRSIPAQMGKVVAAVNGDFYVVDHGPYLGDSRGLQIMNGELTSSPGDQTVFWIDAAGDPHIGTVDAKFALIWPDGTNSRFHVNEERGNKEIVLYTPRLGSSTRTSGGREAVLVREPDSPAFPLAVGKTYKLKVVEIRDAGDSPLAADQVVLSFGPKVSKAASLQVGNVLTVVTATEPDLAGVPTALGGGNIMIQGGRTVEFNSPLGGSYKYRSVVEQHPRSAIGFNNTHIFLVEVDGRQPELSRGVTLAELGDYMRQLGCTEAMNFDGGGSSTLWLDGRVMNSPCNGGEREIGNSLLLVRKPTAAAQKN